MENVMQHNVPPSNTHIEYDRVKNAFRCIPDSDENVVGIKSMGGMTKLICKIRQTHKDVNLKDVHDFNVGSGFLQSDEESKETRKSESKRISLSHARETVREIAAYNPWKYFFTITIDRKKLSRTNIDIIHDEIIKLFDKWKRMQITKVKPYKDLAYLMVPEFHKDGKSIHVHGFLNIIPEEYYIKYTMEDVNSSKKLPKDLCIAIKKGYEVGHCYIWDEKFGFNCVEVIKDQDRISNYITKYINKSIDNSPTSNGKPCYWNSRGLNRSKVIGSVQLPPGQKGLEEYTDLILPYAAIDSRGNPMHYETYRPATAKELEIYDSSEILTGYKTTIDRETLSSEETYELLSDRFEILK